MRIANPIKRPHPFIMLLALAISLSVAPFMPAPHRAAAATVCSGVSGSVGSFTFQPLHVDSGGILRDGNNCDVVLSGFNLAGTGDSTGDSYGSDDTTAELDNMFKQIHTLFPHTNMLRVPINSYWYVHNYPYGTQVSQPNMVKQFGTYNNFVTYVVTETAKYGMYLDITSNTMYQEPIGCQYNGASCAAEAQGNCDYSSLTSNGCHTYDPPYRYSPYGCASMGIITSTHTAWDDLATQFNGDNHMVINVWGEAKAQCGVNPPSDPEESYSFTAPGVCQCSGTNTYSSYVGGNANGDGVRSPDYYTVWYFHQKRLVDEIRLRAPNMLVTLTADSFGNNYCPIAGDVNSATTCNGHPALNQDVSSLGTNIGSNGDFIPANMLWDYHTYPGSCYDCTGSSETGDWLTKKTNYPAHWNWDIVTQGEQHFGRAQIVAESVGSSDTTNDNDFPCYLYEAAHATHTGVLQYELSNVISSGLPGTGTFSLNTLGKATQNNQAYMFGAASNAQEENQGTCPTVY